MKNQKEKLRNQSHSPVQKKKKYLGINLPKETKELYTENYDTNERIIEKVRVFQKNIYFCFIDYAEPLNVWITRNWKILKRMGITDHLTYLLRNLYAGQEVTVRTGHGPTDWFQIGKEVRQGCILSPCLFNLYEEYIMKSTGLEEAQAGIKREKFQ